MHEGRGGVTAGRRDGVDAFIAMVRAVSTVCGVVAVILLIAAILVVAHLVFVRYVLAASAIWQHEVVTYALIASTFLGSPYVLMTRGHVNVDLLPLYLPPWAGRALAFLAAGLGLLFCLVLTWQGWIFFLHAWETGETGATIFAPPLWIPRLTMPVGLGLMCLQYVADIIALATGRPAAFVAPEKRP